MIPSGPTQCSPTDAFSKKSASSCSLRRSSWTSRGLGSFEGMAVLYAPVWPGGACLHGPYLTQPTACGSSPRPAEEDGIGIDLDAEQGVRLLPHVRATVELLLAVQLVGGEIQVAVPRQRQRVRPEHARVV